MGNAASGGIKAAGENAMSFKVQVGPAQISIHQGQTVLVSEPDGAIHWPSDHGLYFLDTRVISAWAAYANGEEWGLLNGGAVAYDEAHIFLTNRAVATQEGAIPPRSLSFVIARKIRPQELGETLTLTNHGLTAACFNLEIAIRSDFADIFEVKSNRIVRRGRIASQFDAAKRTLTTTYRNHDFLRAVRVSVIAGGPEMVYANGRISFAISLDPGHSWKADLSYALIDGVAAEAEAATLPHEAEWRTDLPKLNTSNEEFYRMWHQAVSDMAALRLPFTEDGELVQIPAAGMPWFLAPFGRDSLIVSLQTILLDPGFARGALAVLGALQAKEYDSWRDAEPGKIPHEMRYGELAHFKLIPHTPYYGTADATPLYLIVLHAAWRASGDRGLLDRHLATAEACLAWIDKDGDRDGDGFQEYQTRSPVGYENMAWKDSGDSVNWPDGKPVAGPKALCELQAYVYDAWQRMAEIYDVLDRPADAARLREKAAALFARFNAVFWNEKEGFYAYALDGAKQPVFSVASNPGHCLWSGLVPPERAARVVARLLAPDMDSGWGIRTLSAEHVTYNPYSYQNGSVWPHDNSLIALGFKRYGFATEVAHVARAISGAASHFLQNQLPELYAGIAREADGFPVQYLGANVPQAWAAGSVFALLQALLGIAFDAPNGTLYVDPALPAWLPDITLRDLKLGKQSFDLDFRREKDGSTSFTVLRGDAKAVQRGKAANVPG